MVSFTKYSKCNGPFWVSKYLDRLARCLGLPFLSSATPILLPPPSVSSFMIIKLDRSNYSLWFAKLVLVLHGRKLMGIVDGYIPCPPHSLSDDDGNCFNVVNPDFESWFEKDQIILGWINTSFTPTVVSTVARATSTHATWLFS
ncbi:putative transcription factor interactor and regulator CCHC(Zn) family [Abeliophyllum distichum]|uniref:Transcription factor interactor and regulator CCHC(Zn) family n=1 Tax=Abeliophyllum distichum TaxID=126358 RepID=A0ABD1UN53_9LAMI